MLLKHKSLLFVSIIVFVLSITASAKAQNKMSAGQNMAQMKFIQFPGMPTCSSGSVQSGNPAQGSSVILIKVNSGCSIPWHWHTPNEHLMFVSGTGVAQMKDGMSVTLKSGGYAMMPASQVHQFRCTAACLFYLYSDGAFDMHYVDAQGKEIDPAAALKKVKETPAKGSK